MPGALIASDMLSDDTTTDDSGTGAQSFRRERVLRQSRASYRRRVYPATAAEIADGERQALFQTQAVTKLTRAKYREVLAQCRA